MGYRATASRLVFNSSRKHLARYGYLAIAHASRWVLLTSMVAAVRAPMAAIAMAAFGAPKAAAAARASAVVAAPIAAASIAVAPVAAAPTAGLQELGHLLLGLLQSGMRSVKYVMSRMQDCSHRGRREGCILGVAQEGLQLQCQPYILQAVHIMCFCCKLGALPLQPDQNPTQLVRLATGSKFGSGICHGQGSLLHHTSTKSNYF